MGQLSQHPGHKVAARDRIENAREHYRIRASRRVNKAPQAQPSTARLTER